MKKLATRAAMITAVAFSIFLGSGGLAPEEADARMNAYCNVTQDQHEAGTKTRPGNYNCDPE